MKVRIGIIGDHDPNRPSHPATEEALDHAAQALATGVDITWMPTLSLRRSENEGTLRSRLCSFDALWCAPGGPYRSMEGALSAVRAAREGHLPLIGT